MDKDKLKRLDSLKASINKRFGADTVMTAKEAAEKGKLSKKVLKTPSLELNDALHCGGFSGIVELFGANSSGKTSLAIDTIVLNQKTNPDFVVAWLETEGSVTETILQDHGVDLDRIIYWRQEDAGNAESALDIARAFITSGDVDAMVVNSIAGLCPKVENEDDLEKQNIALVARLLSKFFRVATGIASKNDVTMIFINQVRDNVGQMFGDPATTTGGKALAFYASQRIRMGQKKIMAGDPIKEEDGVKIGCIVKKNRFAGKHNPYTKCDYYATFANGIDSIISMPQLLLNAGIVRQAGAWWYYENENGKPYNIGGIECKFRSKNDFLEALHNNQILYNELLSKINGLSSAQNEEEMAEIEAENAAINAEMEIIAKTEMSEDINDILNANDL